MSSTDHDEILHYGYYYRYDSKGRMIAKKLPGADWVYYIYDKYGRMIMSQDGNQRTRGEWSFFLEDHIGRSCIQGTWIKEALDPFSDPYGNVSVYVLRNNGLSALYGYLINGITLTSPKVLVVNWWDNYSFPVSINMGSDGSYDAAFQSTATADTPYSASSRGLRTGGMVRTLGEDVENHYLWDVCWYDDKAKPVQTVRKTAIGDVIREGYAYDFTGNVIRKYTRHSLFNGNSVTESYSYTYDGWGRPLETSLSLNGDAPITLHDYSYDSAGRLCGDRQKDNTGSITSKISLNIRSWITEKLVTSPSQDTLFRQSLHYQNTTGVPDAAPRWNGNVSAQIWNTGSLNCRYNYFYDGLGRLTDADYYGFGHGLANHDRSYGYDKHGNVISAVCMERNGSIGNYTSYTYTGTYQGNQLVTSSRSATLGGPVTNTSYGYDSNGNMTRTSNTPRPGLFMERTTYNLLNLPSKWSFGLMEENYVYSAMGEKLSRTWKSAGVSHKTDYSGNLVYVDSTLTTVLVDCGYYHMSDSAPSFHVLITDYQGNVHVDTRLAGTEKSTYQYAPYGEMTHMISLGNGDENLYRFSGKEWDKTLSCYDFGARYYKTGAIPVWTTLDPLCEKYYDISPYAYCAGNPVNLVDPDGKDIWGLFPNGGISWISANDLRHELFVIDNDGQYTGKVFKMKDDSVFSSLSGTSGNSSYIGKSEEKNNLMSLFLFLADNSSSEWALHLNEDNVVLGTMHETDHVGNWQTFGLSSRPTLSIHSHPGVYSTKNEEYDSIGLSVEDGIYSKARRWENSDWDYMQRASEMKAKNYLIYFPHSNHFYQIGYPNKLKMYSNLFSTIRQQ